MIEVHCPNCGRRNVTEYRYIGERQARPDPNTADPVTWRGYLYLRDNPAGWVDETWLHRSGCRRYLAVERNTVTNEIRMVRELADGATGPGRPAGPAAHRARPPESRDRSASPHAEA